MNHANFDQPFISSINGCVAIVKGEYNYRYNSKFRLSKNATGTLLTATPHHAKLLIQGDIESISVGSKISEIEDSNKIEVYSHFFGSIVNANDLSILYPLANKNSASPPIASGKINAKSVSIFNRVKVHQPLESGIVAIDMMIPVGKGQRQLIIGDRKTGKTSIALSFIINQRKTALKIIYVSIGQKKTSIQEFYNDLKRYESLKNTIILYSQPDQVASQYFAPYIGMGMAEALAFQGYDVLIIIDDLSKHANIYREIALFIDKPVGKEAFPGDMFYTHARLLERAGKFDSNYKNGSITCLPIVETINEDISNTIASNIISITDGQIFTSSLLFNSGVRPAINIGLSVSRLGSTVQSKINKSLSENLIKIYSDYLKFQKLEAISFEVNSDVANIIKNGKVINTLLNQPDFINYESYFLEIVMQLLKWNWLINVEELDSIINCINNFMNNDLAAIKIKQRIILEGCTQRNEFLLKSLLAPLIKRYYELNKVSIEQLDFKDLKIKIINIEMDKYIVKVDNNG